MRYAVSSDGLGVAMEPKATAFNAKYAKDAKDGGRTGMTMQPVSSC
jgi:hypothetical protein